MNAAAILAIVTASPMTAPQVAAALGYNVPADVLMFQDETVDAIEDALCAAVADRVITARKVAFADEWATYGTREALS